jgi:choline dehydrogenase-like flavoprotein
VGAFGLLDEEIYEEAGPGATVALCDFNHGNPGVVGGGMLANEFITLPYLFCRVRPPGEARWGRAHKEFQRRNYKRVMRIQGPAQEIPNFSARVTVDPGVEDHWGIPVCRLSGSRHHYDLQSGEFLSKKAEAIIKETGATEVWRDGPKLSLSGGQHQAGTCRMGNDPKTSVTNRYGQVHEIDNLFIADGSLHVNNGGFNPSLTIMALAYWVSDHIKNGWKGSRFR